MVVPLAAANAVERYLAHADRAIPGRIMAFYIVGSAALGALQPGRSDLDFVAVVDRPLDAIELERLRRAQRRLYLGAFARAASHVPWRLPITCNGIFIQSEDLARSPLQVAPMAGHVAGKFSCGSAFDVNPVTWRVLADFGIAVRGADRDQLDVYRSDSELRSWTLGNLNSYWRQWAKELHGIGLVAAKALVMRYVAWGVLGTSRMHFTIATGAIASKTQACDYALEVFAPRWRPLLEETQTYWLGSPRTARYTSPLVRRRDTADFVSEVIDSAGSIAER
jgi:hypothetical protein